MAIYIAYCFISLLIIAFLVTLWKIIFPKKSKIKVFPAYVIAEPDCIKDKEVVTYVKGYKYKINYPIEVI